MTTAGRRVATVGRCGWPYRRGALSPSQALSACLGVPDPGTATEAHRASRMVVMGTGVVVREAGNNVTTTTVVSGRGRMAVTLLLTWIAERGTRCTKATLAVAARAAARRSTRIGAGKGKVPH